MKYGGLLTSTVGLYLPGTTTFPPIVSLRRFVCLAVAIWFTVAIPTNTSSAMTTSIIRGACPHDCPDTCALLITVKDGVATEVRGDPDHPPTNGALCTKVARYTERTYHKD